MSDNWDLISSAADDDWDSISSVEQTEQPKARTTGQEVGRQLSLTGRGVVETAAAIPLAAADFGMGVRNLITGEGRESPSSMFSGALDKLYGARETNLEKGVGVAVNAIAGSKIPVPGVKAPAPVGYQNAAQLKAAETAAKVKAHQKAGYVVPPSTSNPTAVNKVLEGLSGKIATAQQASVKNTGTTEKLASRGLGLSEDVPLTAESVQALRTEAGEAYEVVRRAGPVELGQKFNAAVDKALAVATGANKSFPGLADDPSLAKIEALRQPAADASDIVDAIKIVRDLSDTAYRSGSKLVGKTYKEVARALEDALDERLVRLGDKGAIEAFRNARTLIAKSHTIESAMRKSGQVSPANLAGDLAKGKPLDGEIKQIAEFGRDFPKASRTLNESFPGLSPLDAYAAMGTAGISKNPLYLGMPFLRLGARNALLSPLGQRLAVPSQGGPISPEIAAALAQGGALVRQ
jgi:hypothetical protein